MNLPRCPSIGWSYPHSLLCLPCTWWRDGSTSLPQQRPPEACDWLVWVPPGGVDPGAPFEPTQRVFVHNARKVVFQISGLDLHRLLTAANS